MPLNAVMFLFLENTVVASKINIDNMLNRAYFQYSSINQSMHVNI